MADTRSVNALERIAFGAIGMTARAIATTGEAPELTFSQWRCLVIAGESPEGKRVGEIAARIGLQLPGASRLCHRLERRGLVAAERDERDRRATVIRLTDRGIAARERVLAARRRFIEEVLESVETPDATFLEQLESVAGAFERYR